MSRDRRRRAEAESAADRASAIPTSRAERTTSKAALRWLAPSATIGTVTRSASSRSPASGSPEPIHAGHIAAGQRHYTNG
jgi:hypothetical protein